MITLIRITTAARASTADGRRQKASCAFAGRDAEDLGFGPRHRHPPYSGAAIDRACEAGDATDPPERAAQYVPVLADESRLLETCVFQTRAELAPGHLTQMVG